jgi:hypothetical protein
MISLDESGTTLVFSPDPENQEDITLLLTMPRVIRTTEKQDFVKLLDRKLWMAARLEHNGTGQRLPIIRIYDVFNPASTGRSMLPIEHVGPVRSATIIPSQPRMVYVGHEEGFISMRSLTRTMGILGVLRLRRCRRRMCSAWRAPMIDFGLGVGRGRFRRMMCRRGRGW